MTEKKPIKKLSKGLLDLKFMKKTKERVEIEHEDEERKVLYQDQLVALNSPVVMVPSHFDLMTYLPCRLSFGGLEKDIEKLNEPKMTGLYTITKEEIKEEQDEEADVSKEEMAAHFTSLNENLAKKFKKRPLCNKQFAANKKRKSGEFLKPKD